MTRPPRRAGAQGPRSEARLFAGLGHIALAVWAVIVIVPILWTFLAAFKNTTEIFSSPWTLPAELRWENFGRAWTKANVGRYFLNSVIVVSCSTFLTMLLGSMAAYVLARYRFWGNRAVYYLFVSGLAFPVFLALVPLFFVVKNLACSARTPVWCWSTRRTRCRSRCSSWPRSSRRCRRRWPRRA
ncbi:hypothetical protein NKG94_49525 [Micromonospora sp. M12]